MGKIILLAETGSDITREVAERYGIYIVPMHVSFGEETRDDASFPAEEICGYYERTGNLPKTSGSVPEDFEKIFDRIHEEHPEGHILYFGVRPDREQRFPAVWTAVPRAAFQGFNHRLLLSFAWGCHSAFPGQNQGRYTLQILLPTIYSKVLQLLVDVAAGLLSSILKPHVMLLHAKFLL